jgi:hypothetical protein
VNAEDDYDQQTNDFRLSEIQMAEDLNVSIPAMNAVAATMTSQLSAAQTARDKANEWAENAEDTEVETGQFSALHHAAKASASATAAATARDLADDYANADEDVAVGAGFSAKHFSLKTEALKNEAQTAAAAAAAGAGLPSLTGNAGKGLRVSSDETGVEFANLGGLIPVAKYTVSSPVAALEFTLPSGFTAFEIRVVDMVPATSGAFLYMRTSADTGSTFDASADYDTAVMTLLGLANQPNTDTADDEIAISSTRSGLGITSGGLNSRIFLEGVSASERTAAQWSGNHQTGTGMAFHRGAARLLAEEITDAVQFIFSTGNIASGVVHVYGVLDGDA